jgi:glutamate racemase
MTIGVFDSGLGGLTIVRTMLEQIKGADIIYIADTANAPYGEKSKQEILDFSVSITEYFLMHYAIDALVIACNTATSAAVFELRERYPNLSIIGTEPGLKPAFSHSKTHNVGILATPATLNGDKYKHLRDDLAQQYNIHIYEQACHGLVEQIEAGETSTPKTLIMLETWLSPMRQANVDTIVLGCTHYPLITHEIQNIMNTPVKLIQTADAVSKRTLHLLEQKGHINQGNNTLAILATGTINSAMIETILSQKFRVDTIELTK